MNRRLAMMWCLSCLLAAPLFGSAREASAQEPEIPPVVLSGLEAYKQSGPEQAFKIWLAGSPVEGEKIAMSQVNGFRQVESLYGPYQGFDPIRIVPITPNTTLVYLQINFQKGPLFSSFMCYQTKSGWVITWLNFHTEVDKILPPNILYAR